MTNISVPEQEPLPDDLNRNTNNDSSSRQSDLPSRYWSFLFDNLKRSIEQIYQTCESDQNPEQCQEVLQFLYGYCKDFEILMKNVQHLQNLASKIDNTKRSSHSTSLITLPYQTEMTSSRSFGHSESICNGELICSGDLSSRQKRLHNSDINLNVNNLSHHHYSKRQKSNKYRKSTESSSILSLPSLFSSTTLTGDSTMTLIAHNNSKRILTDETAGDADDEKDIRDESFHTNRHHRYHHQLSTSSHYRLKQQTMTSEEDDDDDDEILSRNHDGMIDFMDRQIFDAFDQEESLTAALEAEQERTIASLMAEQEDLEHQLNNVSDDDLLLNGDDGSELEESELSTTKTSSYFMSLQDERDEKDVSPVDLSRDDNDSDPDGKSRVKHLRIHEKLSSPSRIRPLSETLREAAERQERAFTRRQILRDEKARKMRELTHRVNEVRQWKEELIKARKTTIEMKMQRAEEKRQYLLLLKAKKAGDEDLKGQEIAFITSLQQENRRKTLKERYQKEEQFKQYLEEERVRKHDEHKQRELAAENRRKELEAIRQTRLNEMQERWKTKERMIEQQLIEKRKQKQTAAIAKQKIFQQKRAEQVAVLKTSTAELQKKLALKQEESTRRHVTLLEEVRRKAMEMSTLRGPSAEDRHHASPAATDDRKALTTSTTNVSISEEPIATRKCCTLCNLLLASDLHLQTHLRGTRHNQLLFERFNQKNENGIKKQPKQQEIGAFNTECIVIVTNDDIVRQEMAYNRERKHAMKKRAKKLRLRMNQRAAAYEAENAQRPYLSSTHKARIQRFLNELEKSLNTTARKEPLNTTNYLACQRILTEFVKIFDTHGYEKDSPLEQRVFFSLNGYSTLTKMIDLRAESNKPPLAPEGLIALTVAVYRAATHNNLDNAIYILNSGKILTLVESLVRHLTGLKIDDSATNTDQSESERLAQIDLVTNLAQILATLLTMYNSITNEIRKRENETNDDKLTISRLTDLISYMANVGVLDRIASFFRTARAIVNTTKSRVVDLITHLLNLLQQMIHFSKSKISLPPFGQSSKKSTNDPAQVLSIMKSTNFCEILSLLYGILVHDTDNNTNNSNTTTTTNHHPTIPDNNNTITIHEKTFTAVINSMILLNTLAILDLDTFQTTLGEDTISLQLRHVANYILAFCNHQQTTINDTLLRQIILLIGYYCVLNQDNQCRLAFGNRPTVLQQLSCLPYRYFLELKYMDILFPTLIACSYDCETTRTILQTEMSLDLIANYIQTKLNETTPTIINEDDLMAAFHMRFPRDEWNNALKYYQPMLKLITESHDTYRRVQKRDALRRRVQKHQSKSSESQSSYQYDPLDHSLYWYPVAYSYELSYGSRRPFGFYLLNEPLCLYRRNDGEVVCVLDLCPHRSAPLSLGQITKEGNLECIYHGWQYGTNGQCVFIPSVSKKSNTPSLICARTVPVHEQYGLIWIWPGKRELANSDLIPHHLFSDVQDANGSFLLSPEEAWNLDLPYDLMVDNLLDLAHIDFIHDKVIGKRSDACCIRSEKMTPSPFLSTNSESASFILRRHEQPLPLPPVKHHHFHFIPPCFVRLEHYGHRKGYYCVQIFAILPSAENKMRLLMQIYRNFVRYKWFEYIPGYDYITDKFTTKIVNQDILLLFGIQRNISEMGAKPLGTIVSADGPIKAFRRYHARALAKYGTIYVKQGAWTTTTTTTKSSNDGINEIDIEDLKMEIMD